MNRIFTYYIDKDLSINTTILDYLKSLRYSQGLIAHLKRTPNGIQKNGTWAYVRDSLKIGDTLTISLEEQETSEAILPVNLPLEIIYEDQDLMIINKAANMPIHPSQGNHENTLANAVAWYYKTLNRPFIYRCINRLDRDTTGLLILAKNAYSAALLSNMVGSREIHREYLAIVTGELPNSGQIIAPIGRVDGSTIEREVREDGDYACTNYKKIQYENGYTLASITLETGRTHQIRVHMKSIGHPLPGDFLYYPNYDKICRQALHSHRLKFVHPITQENLSFTSSLPDDMASFFSSTIHI
ncbi:MAG: RluA family pseudouridine synthase [Eubacteriales bacterium]